MSKNISVLAMSVHFFSYDFKGALCCLSGTQRDVPSGLSERAVSSSVCVCEKDGIGGTDR